MHSLLQKLAYRTMRLRPLNLERRSATNDAIARRILADGIAVVPWRDLFGEDACQSVLFQRLKAEAVAFSRRPQQHDAKDWKSGYLKRRYKPGEQIEPESPLHEFLADSRLAAVLRAFFGSPYRLLAADYWHSVPTIDAPAGSQRWHSDPEDTVMCKVFLYFSNVDSDAGATDFLPGSQVGGDASLRRFEIPGTSGRYYSDAEMKEVLAHGVRPIKACGPEGSLVFINTTGIHRGGRGSKDRLMGNFIFVSPWCPLPARWNGRRQTAG